jgi:hypothetical protein
MRKPIFPRILLIALLYIGIFILLVSVQFANLRDFTMRVGGFVISGQLGQSEDSEQPPNEYYLDGNVHVIFGGMSFDLVNRSNGRSLNLIGTDGNRLEALPEYMIISDDSAHFVFSGGTELVFTSNYIEGGTEIRIAGIFAEDVTGIELPFAPQRRTRIPDAGNGHFIAVSGGINYSFGNSPMDAARMVLFVDAGGRPVSYRAIPDRLAFSPNDFILPQAETEEAYNEYLIRWRDGNFALWNRIVPALNNEDEPTQLRLPRFLRLFWEAPPELISHRFTLAAWTRRFVLLLQQSGKR